MFHENEGGKKKPDNLFHYLFREKTPAAPSPLKSRRLIFVAPITPSRNLPHGTAGQKTNRKRSNDNHKVLVEFPAFEAPKTLSSRSCRPSSQLTPPLALGAQRACTPVGWRRLSGEIAAALARSRLAPLIATNALPCPRLQAGNRFLEMFWPQGLAAPAPRVQQRRFGGKKFAGSKVAADGAEGPTTDY